MVPLLITSLAVGLGLSLFSIVVMTKYSNLNTGIDFCFSIRLNLIFFLISSLISSLSFTIHTLSSNPTLINTLYLFRIFSTFLLINLTAFVVFAYIRKTLPNHSSRIILFLIIPLIWGAILFALFECFYVTNTENVKNKPFLLSAVYFTFDIFQGVLAIVAYKVSLKEETSPSFNVVPFTSKISTKEFFYHMIYYLKIFTMSSSVINFTKTLLDLTFFVCETEENKEILIYVASITENFLSMFTILIAYYVNSQLNAGFFKLKLIKSLRNLDSLTTIYSGFSNTSERFLTKQTRMLLQATRNKMSFLTYKRKFEYKVLKIEENLKGDYKNLFVEVFGFKQKNKNYNNCDKPEEESLYYSKENLLLHWDLQNYEAMLSNLDLTLINTNGSKSESNEDCNKTTIRDIMGVHLGVRKYRANIRGMVVKFVNRLTLSNEDERKDIINGFLRDYFNILENTYETIIDDIIKNILKSPYIRQQMHEPANIFG